MNSSLLSRQKSLIYIYDFINQERKKQYSSYEVWAGRALISRLIASRVTKKYSESDDVPDIQFSTLLHMALSLKIDLGEMFSEMQKTLGDQSSDYDLFVNDEKNLKD